LLGMLLKYNIWELLNKDRQETAATARGHPEKSARTIPFGSRRPFVLDQHRSRFAWSAAMPKAPKYTNKSQRDRPPPKVPIAETLAKAEAAAASPYARPASNKEKKRKRIEQKGEIHKTGAFFYVPEPRKKRKKTTGVSGERGEGGGEEAEPGVEENEEEEEEELDEAQKYLLSVR
jgi:hypothetical protein